MFTGLIDHSATITDISTTPEGVRLRISSCFDPLKLGESITLDGACVTAFDQKDGYFSCNLSPETLRVTIASTYHIGQKVHLERSLLASDRLGGHYVTGHVDRVVPVSLCIKQNDYTQITFSGFTQDERRYLVPKGSITINGVSLTINTVEVATCVTVSVMLIPHTLDVTTFDTLKEGDQVNVEFDYFAKIIAHQFAIQQEVLTCMTQ